jgi:hypothetical protein
MPNGGQCAKQTTYKMTGATTTEAQQFTPNNICLTPDEDHMSQNM